MEENKEITNNKIIAQNNITLNDEQKLLILKRWNESEIPPSISDLVKLAWPDIDISLQDGRSLNGRTVKEFLISKDLKPIIKENPGKRNVELDDAQKEYILNNCATMKPLEMARELFSNSRLSPASIEARAVVNYYRTIDPKIIYGNDVPEADYNPPKQTMHVLARIKKYVSATEGWEQKKLSPIQKKCCESLIHYLHDYRFKRQIDSYEKTEDKITFESEFVKYTYNKIDLEQEDISQYVSLCSFIVMDFNIKENIEMLQTIIQNEYDNNHRVAESIVKALESSRQDLNNSTLRQKQLYEALTEKRSEKLSKEMKDKESLLNLFNTWKNEESRKRLLQLRQKQKENLRKEIEEIESMDEMMQRCMGLSKDEIMNA